MTVSLVAGVLNQQQRLTATSGLFELPTPWSTVHQNSQIFSQSSWTTSTDQYCAYYEGSTRHVIVTKRSLTSDVFASFDLFDDADDVTGVFDNNDTHLILAIALDSDGYIHVISSDHNSAFRYMKSVSPEDVTDWEVGTIAGLRASPAYPYFIRCNDQELLLSHRDVSVGYAISAYDTSTATWSERSILVDADAYINPIAIDRTTGRLSMFWTWRLNLTAEFPGNQDIMFAYSDDNGSTWRKLSDDSAYALPITTATGEVVKAVAESENMLNTCGACVTIDGNPHSAWKLNDGSENTQLMHVWHDGTTWNSEVVTSFVGNWGQSANHDNFGRPQIMSFLNGDIWMIYSGPLDDRLLGVDVTTPGSPVEFVVANEHLNDFEASVDWEMLRRFDKLSCLIGSVETGSVLTNVATGYSLVVGPTDTLPVSAVSPVVLGRMRNAWWSGDPAVDTLYDDTDTIETWPAYRGNITLTQSTVGARPAYTASLAALGNVPAVAFDGSEDFMVTASNFQTLEEPSVAFAVVNIRTVETGMRVLDGVDAARMIVFESSGNWAFHKGATATGSTAVTTGAHAIIAVFNGASSSLYVDGVLAASGNTGTSDVASLKLSLDRTASTSPSDIDVAFVGVGPGPLSTDERAAFFTWAADTYGTPNP